MPHFRKSFRGDITKKRCNVGRCRQPKEIVEDLNSLLVDSNTGADGTAQRECFAITSRRKVKVM